MTILEDVTNTALVDVGLPPQPPWNFVQLLKGALILIDRTNSQSKITVPFQYNPNTLTRSLQPKYYQSQGDRYTGPAGHTIDVKVQLEGSADGGTSTNGILPQIAALELMINPKSADLTTYMQDMKSNKLKAVPPLAPRTLFVWGPQRVLPVRLTSISFTETMFNNNLTPMIADVGLKMEVYPFDQISDADYQYLFTYLQNLETLRSSLSTAGVNIGVTVSGLT